MSLIMAEGFRSAMKLTLLTLLTLLGYCTLIHWPTSEAAWHAWLARWARYVSLTYLTLLLTLADLLTN